MSGTAWPAVLTLARLELRRRWPAIVALGVAAAAAAGAVLAVAVVEWRTDSAYPRLVDRSGLEDVQVQLFHQFATPGQEAAAVRAASAAADRLRSRPEVAGATRIDNFLGRLRGPGVVYVSVAAPRAPYGDVGVPVVVAGRSPRADRPDEVIVDEGRARLAHLGVGARVRLDLLTPRQFQQFSTGIGRPAGGAVDLRVVGVFRYPQPAPVYNSLIASPAFAAARRPVAVGQTLLVRTRAHSGPGPFKAAAAALNQQLTARFGPAQLPYVAVSAPRSEPDPGLAPTRAVLRWGLLALAAVVLGAGVVLVLQLAGRWTEQGREGQQVEAVLGLRTRERVAARLLAAAPAVALAAGGAATGALLAGSVEPLGALRRYEPDPGWLAAPALTAWGAAAAAALVVVAVGGATATATRTGRANAGRRRHRTSTRPAPLVRLAGALAAGRGGPDTALPVRSVVAALAAVLAATVVVADVHRQLAGIAGHPARWGWTADFQVVDDSPAVDARLRADPRAADVERLDSTRITVRVGGHDTALVGYGRATLRGRLPWTVTAGRVPERPGEIALGPRAAHDLDVGVGDRLRARAPAGPVPLTVVGLVVLPSGNQEPLGRNALVTGGQLARLGGATPFSGLLVRGTDPPTGRALQRELARTLEIDTPRPPETVTALDELGRPMRILLAVLLLAVLLLLGQHVRVLLRRRRGQLGIAHVLGVPRRHLVVATVSAALGPTLLATVIGGVVGWAATRLLLNEVGPRIGLGFTRPAFGPPLWIAAGAVGAALVVAAGAAVRATARIDRDRPRD